MKYPTQEYVEKIKEKYPVGTIIELTADMDDSFSPILKGTQGEVIAVDDMGTLHMKWDNSRSLGVVPYEDAFKVISKPEEQELTMGGMSL